MSDYDSSLPVRTEAAGDVDVFISDATIPAQKLKVNADGSIDVNAVISATDLDIRDLVFATDKVDVSGSAVTVSSTDLDIRDLLFASDSVDVSGSAVTVSATDLDVRDLLFASDSVDVSGSAVTVSATDLDVRDLLFANDSVDVSGSAITAIVSATDLDIRDLDAASDSVAAHISDASGVAFSSGNPLPVVFSSDLDGDEILDYNTSAAIAKDASVNHDYTVSGGKTLIGEEAWISGSGKLKAELLVNGSVVYTAFNSTANPNIRIPLEKILKANAAEVVRITITNKDKQAQDLYSTLAALEV